MDAPTARRVHRASTRAMVLWLAEQRLELLEASAVGPYAGRLRRIWVVEARSMTIGEFAEALSAICQKHGGSVTSWGRTVKHSIAVGGFDGDPHTWFLGADVVYDTDRPSATKPNNPEVDADAATRGLRVIHEATHDHFQPSDFVNRAHTAEGVAYA